ncbi:MAG: hydroxymethylbilane synthase [Salibacteraceae bacterium]
MNKKIRIGSRGSDLALWQAHYFENALKQIGVDSEIIIITTKGDRIQHLSFDKIEGKGFFTKEIEEALLNEHVDVAIHSHKDLETQAPEGLKIAGVSYRENPSDLLLINPDAFDLSQPLHLKQNAIVGTSSARRKGQITTLRPDVSIKDIRGNVPTRVNKLRTGSFDAILIAFAGIHRLQLDLSDLKVEELDPRLFIPAPAQGVLAFQCREHDDETTQIIQQLHRSDIAEKISIERSILSIFGGGCHIPIGAYAEKTNNAFDIRVSYATEWENFNSRMRFSAQSLDEALATFQHKRKSGYPKSVFFSRDLSETSFFGRAAKAHNIDLHAQSLIKITPLAFTCSPDEFDVVFFSSSNAVHTFFEQEKSEDWQHKSFATAGEATAMSLNEYISTIDFIGEGSEMSEVSSDFSEKFKGNRCLFPVSSKSLKTIQQAIPEKFACNVVCYETSSVSLEIPTSEAYVFTSPSNVSAFLEAGNKIPEQSDIIAIGSSTAKALTAVGFNCKIAAIPHEAELFALLAK